MTTSTTPGPDSSGASEVFTIVILSIAFLWIAAVGSSRVLKVLDRRNYLMGARNNNFFQNNAGNVNNNYYGTTVGSRTPRSTMNVSGAAGGGGGGSMGGGGVGAGVYGSTFMPNLWCDNRFVFGFFAILLGIGRAGYLITFMFLSNANDGGGDSIAGDNVLSDTVTAPLAWFFFSLLAAILWTLRDLLDRVKSLIGNNNNNSSSNSHAGTDSNLPSPLPTPSHRRNASGENSSTQRTPSSQQKHQHHHEEQEEKAHFNASTDSKETIETAISMKTQHQNLGNTNENQNQNQQQETLPETVENSEDELATPVRVVANSGQFDTRTVNTENENNQNNKSWSEKLAELRPYRAVITIVIMFVILFISLVVSWIQQQNGDKDAANSQATVVSSVISFLLMFWSIYSSGESIIVMRKIGIAAHRVAIAIVVMAIFLLIRGFLVLPPVQSRVCQEGNSRSSFWGCIFAYNFVDCAGIGLILQILP